MARTADVVIIGAGILGPSSAYYLTQAGIGKVLVVDAAQAGGQATRATAAMVMHQTGDESTTRLSKIAIEKYANFRDEVGVDIDFQKVGSVLFSQTENGHATLTQQASMQNALGISTDVWDGTQIQKESKDLVSGEGITHGIFCSEDGYIDANLAVNGYLARAKEHGASILEDTRVTKIVIEAGKVSGVETKDEFISTRTVVNCAGSWANDIARTMEITIPIKASKKCLGIVKDHFSLGSFPIAEDIDSGWYFRPHSQGIMVGFGFGEWVENKDREEFPAFDTKKLEDLSQYAAQRAPQLLPTELVDGWAGYRPMIDPAFGDNLPIIGEVDGIEGYFNNCAFGEFGITHAPAGGELLAQIVTGANPILDPAQFSLSRFKQVNQQ